MPAMIYKGDAAATPALVAAAVTTAAYVQQGTLCYAVYLHPFSQHAAAAVSTIAERPRQPTKLHSRRPSRWMPRQ